MYDAVVVGGGAAGMLAAATAAGRGLKTLLIEKNAYTGKKLGITGKGRCNLTNSGSAREALENIPTGGKFLQSAFFRFTPQDTVRLFEGLGVPLKTERGGRVFPVSDRAADVVSALRTYIARTGVTQKRAAATEVWTDSGAVRAVAAGGETIPCRAVILATGGASYPLTGSTGDGYRMAEALGHRLITPKPSLVPLEAQPKLCQRMQGLSLRNVRLAVRGDNKKIFEDFGELMFTHFGLTGPLILSASAHMRDYGNTKYTAAIDLKPALDEKTLDLRILRDFDKYANRDFANALGELLNRLMIPIIVERSGIEPGAKVHSITKAQRARLLGLIKAFEIEISGPRPIDEAIITSGGVDTREINPATMESKLVSGLYFAGEIIDADAYTGGYNLQIAWSTAYAAGTHIRTGE